MHRLFLPVAAAVLVLAGCDGGGSASQQPPPDPVADPVVVIADMDFQGGAVTVVVGTTVTWRWQDAPIEHDVAFEDGVASPLQAEGSWSRTFDEVGTFPYRCDPHPFMTGVVEVVPAS